MSRTLPLLRCACAALVALIAFAWGGSPRADVLDSSDSGFLVKSDATIVGTPVDVYAALTGKIGSWWNPAHTFSGDAANLSLEARPGGCFCERLPDGGGVRHLEVVYAAPGKQLRLVGALGPLQEHGLSGSMTWTMVGASTGTRVELTYSVGGFRSGGLTSLAAPVDKVLQEQLARLKRFVETGKAS